MHKLWFNISPVSSPKSVPPAPPSTKVEVLQAVPPQIKKLMLMVVAIVCVASLIVFWQQNNKLSNNNVVSSVSVAPVSSVTPISSSTPAIYSAKLHIFDYAVLLTENNNSQLQSKASGIAYIQNIDIVILTTNDPSIRNPRQYADDYYISGSFSDGVMFYIDMANREVLFLTFGSLVSAFESHIDSTLDEVIPFLSDGDYSRSA